MALIDVSTTRPSGLTLYAFPEGQSLANWTTYRIELTESASPNTGYYTAQLDNGVALVYRLFSGASQPSSWSASIEYFNLNQNVFTVSGNVTTVSPVTETGELEDIIIGDDYTVSPRLFSWDVDALAGVSREGEENVVCSFGGKRNDAGWLVTGTITDLGSDRWRLTFSLPRTATENLVEGYYVWSVEVKGPASSAREETRVISKKPVLLKYKQT